MNEIIKFSSDDEDISLEYLYTIGLSHEKRGSPRDAIFYFDKILDVNPNHVNALAHKGNSLGKIGKYEQAIVCYNMVLKIKTYDEICLLNKGLSLHYLRKYDEAVQCYEEILQKTPDNANAAYYMACTKSLQNDIIQALTWLEKAVLLDSKFAEKASADQDFSNLHNNSKFKSLIT